MTVGWWNRAPTAQKLAMAFILTASTLVGVREAAPMLDAYLEKRKNRTEKKQAKQQLAQEYGTLPTKSQAVFIIPPSGARDGYGKVRPYQIRDQFEKNGVPAFVIGDTSGNGTIATVEKNVKAIQDEYCFDAVTVLSLTHGSIHENRTGYRFDSTTFYKQWNVWNERPDLVQHRTSLGNKVDPSTGETMRRVAAAAGAQKMDWVSLSCFAGAVAQKDVDGLPRGSSYIGLSGGGQVNYFSAQDSLLKNLRRERFILDQGVDGTDFLVEALHDNWRAYGADIVIGISGANAPTVILSNFRDNHLNNAEAALANKKQMETAKQAKRKKTTRAPR